MKAISTASSARPRGKTNLLEFHILQDGGRQTMDDGRPTTDDGGNGQSSVVGRLSSGPWALTERTLRDTQMRIEGTLRLDYETFVNASFFLQGKADQFTQQRSGDRKRILGSILELEIWETYRQQAVERRKRVESEISAIDGRLHEISAELKEGRGSQSAPERAGRGAGADIASTPTQEATLENIRKTAATLAEQGRLVEALAAVEAAKGRLREMEGRVETRQKEKETYSQIIAR